MIRRTALLLCLGAALVAGAAWWLRGAPPSPPPAAAAAAPPGVGALGRIEPESRIRKLAPLGGMAVTRVDRLLVREGETVAAGQLLATFADTPQKDTAVAQAEAALAEAQASLARVRAAGRPSEIAAQRARIAALAAAEEIARHDAVRSERLVPSGAETAATADRNRFAAARSAAERAEAEAQLETLLRPRPEDLAVAEAQLASAEAQLDHARADAALSRLVAPIAGTVLKIYARPGDQVGSDGLLDLADLGRLDVVADVFETDLPRLRPGATAEIIVPGDVRRYGATVRELGWQVRRTTEAGTDPVAAVDSRTVEVRLTLDDDGRAALLRRLNMQVQVAIRP
jgi:HlyD family secretion protein